MNEQQLIRHAAASLLRALPPVPAVLVQGGQTIVQYRVTRYLNKSTGKEMPIILDRYCPQGHVVFLPLSVPFPVPEIGNAVEVETNQEYWGVDFAITDSNFRFADYVDETVKVYFLGGLGLLRGIFPSF